MKVINLWRFLIMRMIACCLLDVIKKNVSEFHNSYNDFKESLLNRGYSVIYIDMEERS
jgi:hypothetical protein